MLKKLLLLCLFAFCVNHPKAQTVYSKKQLVEDLRVFKDILVHTDPTLTTKQRDSLEKALSMLIRSFPLDQAEGNTFLKYILNLKLETGYDNHAGVTASAELFPKSAVYFPTPIYVSDDRILVNAEKMILPFGAIIDSINGLSANEILTRLTGSGNKANFARNGLYNSFSFLYNFWYGSCDSFIVSYRVLTDKWTPLRVTCSAIDLNAVVKMQSTRVFPLSDSTKTGLVNTFFDTATKSYYLKLSSFSWPDKDTAVYQKFNRLFDSLFTDIRSKATRYLLLDLRGNGGGDLFIPGLLFSYLTDSVLHEAQYQTMLPPKVIPTEYLKNIAGDPVTSPKKAVAVLNNLTKGAAMGTDGKLFRNFFITSNPMDCRYSGFTVLLIDGGTFSAAAYFAALFKSRNRRGGLLGAAAGSPVKELTAGHMLSYELPNTKLIMEVPLMHISFDKNLSASLNEEYLSPNKTFSFEEKYPFFLKKKDGELTLLMEAIKTFKD